MLLCAVWRANLEKIRQHNAAAERSYTLGMNRFGDLTAEEFSAQYLTFRHVPRAIRLLGIVSAAAGSLTAPSRPETRAHRHAGSIQRPLRHSEALPARVNWVTAGKVTPVGDQVRGPLRDGCRPSCARCGTSSDSRD
jgi:hypothetical protein